ncbi:MAG TPA: peptidylprolyl isomerase [Polyangiaceae bacterium]|nr:peptidylprolyl isomerase [Polyangiaceae bacterium]
MLQLFKYLLSRRSRLTLVGVGAGLLVAQAAQATIIERVVAVVGERAILLTDLRQRATPFLLKVYAEPLPDAQRNAAISQVYRVTLERMVEEELEQRAAAQAKITVTSEEIDQALQVIASQNGIQPEQLIEEAARQGMNETQYRGELRRQVVQQKMANLRLQGRVRVTEDDIRSTYQRLLLQERSQLDYRAAQLVIEIPPGADKATIRQKQELANALRERANNGEDFAGLVAQYSDDPASKKFGGLLPTQKPIEQPQHLARAVMNLDLGRTSRPIRHGNTFVLLKLIERAPSSLPPFEDAKAQLRERVYMEKMGAARRQWLQSLKRRTHVEVRL